MGGFFNALNFPDDCEQKRIWIINTNLLDILGNHAAGVRLILFYSVTPRFQNTYLVAYSDFSIVFFDLLSVFVLYCELFI